MPAGRDRQTSGASHYHLLQVFGKEHVLARIEKALARFPT